MIARSNYDIRSSQIFTLLDWRPINENLDKQELVITFKAQLGLVPNYLTQFFNLNNNINHQLRLYIPKPQTNFLKNSFSYRGAVSWDNLPHNIIDRAITGNMSLSSFKNSLTDMSVLGKVT